MSDEEILNLGCKQAGQSHWSHLDDLGRAQRKDAIDGNGCTTIVFWDADYEEVDDTEHPQGYCEQELRTLLHLPAKYKADTYDLVCEALRKHVHWSYLNCVNEDERKDATVCKGCTVIVFWDKPAK